MVLTSPWVKGLRPVNESLAKTAICALMESADTGPLTMPLPVLFLQAAKKATAAKTNSDEVLFMKIGSVTASNIIKMDHSLLCKINVNC